jgi:hypothetical protein
LAFAPTANATGASASIDRSVVRFYAPETGGAGRPRFVSERVLAFQARLELLAEGGAPNGTLEERHIRAALESHIAEELLTSLPLEKQPQRDEFERLLDDVRTALTERVGGAERLRQAAALEGLSGNEVDYLVLRRARAGLYLDYAVSPVLRVPDDQLHEVYRTAAHPYRGRAFEEVREPLARWFVLERLHVAEGAFLQSARGRVRVTVLTR